MSPEENRSVQRAEHREYDNKHEDNSSNNAYSVNSIDSCLIEVEIVVFGKVSTRESLLKIGGS